jgi:hypothetical protein
MQVPCCKSGPEQNDRRDSRPFAGMISGIQQTEALTKEADWKTSWRWCGSLGSDPLVLEGMRNDHSRAVI